MPELLYVVQACSKHRNKLVKRYLNMNSKSNDKQSYTYYDILQVRFNAKDSEVKKAYLMLVKKCHPDLFVKQPPKDRRLAELRFKLINEAYNHLKRPETKSIYNKQILKSKRIKLTPINDNPNKKNRIKTMINNGWTNITEILWPIAPSSAKRTINHGR